MSRGMIRTSALVGLIVLLGVVSGYFTTRTAFAALNVSKHGGSFFTASSVSGWWHDCTNCSEDAIDLFDPANDCWVVPNPPGRSGNPSLCDFADFVYIGQGQYAADYTITQYGGSCAGRTVTVRYFAGGVWKPLIRLNFVHLKNKASLGTGTLGYSSNLAATMGKTWEAETCGAWSGPHLHYSRNWNYGSSDHASFSSPVYRSTIVFNGYSYP